MRIVLISFSFYEYIIQLANKLVINNDMLVILPALDPAYIDLVDPEINLYLFKYPTKLLNLHNLYSLYGILKQINKFKPDIIHFQRTTHTFFLMPFLRKYHLVTTIHDLEPHVGENSIFWRRDSFISRFIINFTLKSSVQIIVHGENIKKEITMKYNISPNKVNVNPIGEYEVSLFKKFESSEISECENSILFFGKIKDYKGLEYLIKAEPLISKYIPNVKIIIAGAGDFEKYEKMIVNKENFVILNYFIPFVKGAELLQKSNIIVLPYIEASQSAVIPLVYAFKKPVIVTDVGSIPEMVDNGKTGFIIPAKDIKSLANVSIKLLKNRVLRKEMGENGYKKLKKELSWEIVADKTLEIYYKVLSEKR